MSRRRPSLKTAIAVIDGYRKTLSTVGARADILASLDGALRVLHDNSDRQQELFGVEERPQREVPDPFGGRDPRDLTSAEIRDIVDSTDVSRKTLERIATERFAVPKGSMRSFPSIPLLREKIITNLKNEATHRAISGISQGQSNK